jgi:diguanylate cyclase (GGDEF)-like protein
MAERASTLPRCHRQRPGRGNDFRIAPIEPMTAGMGERPVRAGGPPARAAPPTADIELAQRAAEDRALLVIAERVAQMAGPTAVLEEIVNQALALFHAHSAMIARYDDAAARAVFVCGRTRNGQTLSDLRLHLDGQSAPALVYRTGQAARADGRPSSGLEGELVNVAAEMSDAVAAPIVVAGHLWGCIGVGFSDAPAPADAEARAARFAALAGMAIANAQAWEALAHAASTDPLTGLANRRHFEQRLGEEVHRAQRHRRPLSVVLLDIDDFKTINDRYGHQAGDRTLTEVAARLALSTRAGEFAARIGGEEFAWLLPETGAARAFRAAERLRQVIAGTPFAEVGGVTTSAGVSDCGVRGSAQELMARADRALYAAKAAGRNCCRICRSASAGSVAGLTGLT